VVAPEGTGELVIQLGGAATVDLTIDGFKESGLGPKTHLYVKSVLEETAMSFEGEGVPVTAEGRAHVPRQQAGERVAVLVHRDGYSAIQVMAFRLRLQAGENRLTVRLPRLHDVRVVGPARSVSLTCLDPAGAWMHQFGRAQEGEDLVLRFLPPGRYEASAYLGVGNEQKLQFDVPQQTVIRFE
jgi:hypothetical protein